MRILTISSLYPNSIMPTFGVFVENRLCHLVASGALTAHVVAPIPWFPYSSEFFGEYARWAKVPAREHRNGLTIDHPRYPVVPKVGMRIQANMLFRCLRRYVSQLMDEGVGFDLIDAHYFYPDGAAAVRLGSEFDVPVIVTARGTDINFYPAAFPAIRRAIVQTAKKADGIITVCQALKDTIVGFGIDPRQVTVLRNGVDLEHFQPLSRELLRQELGVSEPTLLSVGHLIERKGHHIAIEALTFLPGYKLLVVGEGPEKQQLKALAGRLGLSERVRFLGNVSYDRMPSLYNVADVLVLASNREGWANVLLEAMACGTPVVATNVWGTPEVVAVPEAGRLARDRTANAIAQALCLLFADLPSRADTRAYAEKFSWDETTNGQLTLFRRILGNRPSQAVEALSCTTIS